MTQVIRIGLGGVSAFALRGERVVLVDTGMAWTVSRLKRALDAEGIAPQHVSLILLTHGHADHAAGALAMRRWTGAKLAAHEACAERLRQGLLPISYPRTKALWVLDKVIGRFWRVAPTEVDLLVGDELDLAPFGVAGKVVHTPGHTAGCLSVLLADGQALVGDLLTGSRSGRRAELPYFALDLGQLARSLDRVLAAEPTLVHNAHGAAVRGGACRALQSSLSHAGGARGAG